MNEQPPVFTVAVNELPVGGNPEKFFTGLSPVKILQARLKLEEVDHQDESPQTLLVSPRGIQDLFDWIDRYPDEMTSEFIRQWRANPGSKLMWTAPVITQGLPDHGVFYSCILFSAAGTVVIECAKPL